MLRVISLKVIPIVPRGFCHGVYRAIRIVEEVVKDTSYPRPIHVLGMIVHNRHVVGDLDSLGVVTVDDPALSRLELLDRIDSGTVVITAHGAASEVIRKAKAKGLTVVDATCRDVYRSHDAIKSHLERGYQVIFVGKRSHPETEAITAIDKRIKLVESVADIPLLPAFTEPVFVANQTTFSINDIEVIIARLQERYSRLDVEDEICNATRVRQEAVIAQNQGADLCYIVGDPRSNNTQNLVRLSTEVTKTRTLLIESVSDIDIHDLVDVKTVTVSSGASTPNRITAEVVAFLKAFPSPTDKKTD